MSLAFARFRNLLTSTAGISLDEDKQYLAESRLAPIMRAHGAVDLADLMRKIERRADEKLLCAVIDAMTTNETSFFRDGALFEQIRREMLPELMAKRKEAGRIRIWCAACSTGQEPYSLAMLVEEEQEKLKDWNIEILATDISETALSAARQGVYSQFEVQRGLSTARLLRHFKQRTDHWKISEHLRSRVTFRSQNLMSNFRETGPFDLILCRNVLLYFDPAVKRDVLSRLAKVMANDGCLVLGAAETAGEGNRRFAAESTQRTWLLRRRELASMRLAVGA